MTEIDLLETINQLETKLNQEKELVSILRGELSGWKQKYGEESPFSHANPEEYDDELPPLDDLDVRHEGSGWNPIYTPRNFHSELLDKEYEDMFKVSKEGMERIEKEIKAELDGIRICAEASSLQKLTFVVGYMVSGQPVRMMANTCLVKPATLKILIKEIRPLIAKLHHKFIRRPSTPKEALKIEAGFYKAHGFPRCLGIMDGTKIPIWKPRFHPTHKPMNISSFVDRNLQFSLNSLAIIDHNMLIQFMDLKHPGSVHDEIIFRNSVVYSDLMAGRGWGGLIFNDLGIQPSKYNITKFPENRYLPHDKFNFNKDFCAMRVKVENVFGIIKNKFPLLKNGFPNYHLSTIQETVTALMVIHNIGRLYGGKMVKVTKNDIKTYKADTLYIPRDGENPQQDVFDFYKENNKSKSAIKRMMNLYHGTILHFEGTGDMTTRHEFLYKLGANTRFLDFKKGSKKGHVCLNEKEDVTKLFKNLIDRKFSIGEAEITLRLLNEEETTAYITKMEENCKNEPKKRDAQVDINPSTKVKKLS